MATYFIFSEQLSGLRRDRLGVGVAVGAMAHWSTHSKYCANCGGPGELGPAVGGTTSVSASSSLLFDDGATGAGTGPTPNGMNGTVRFFGFSSFVHLRIVRALAHRRPSTRCRQQPVFKDLPELANLFLDTLFHLEHFGVFLVETSANLDGVSNFLEELLAGSPV